MLFFIFHLIDRKSAMRNLFINRTARDTHKNNVTGREPILSDICVASKLQTDSNTWLTTYTNWCLQHIQVQKSFCSLLFLVLCICFSRVTIFIIHIINGWQLAKMKRVFLTCPCHEIYRDEAVGLKSCKNTWKITIFVKMWNLGQYRYNLIFCQ